VTTTHIFFDVGGVLGSSGWGAEPRALAVEHFGLDAADFDRRHRETEPAQSVFIDDRGQNLAPARALGMRVLRFTAPDRLRRDLPGLGVTA